MDLEGLARRLDHERDGERADDELLALGPGGRRYEVLSLNWDDQHHTWVLVLDNMIKT